MTHGVIPWLDSPSSQLCFFFPRSFTPRLAGLRWGHRQL